MSERHDRGMETRRAVLGDAYVDGKEAAKAAIDEPLQDFITEGAWGSVWSRPHFTRRERSIVTISLLAALGNVEELALHVRATANTGATQEDLIEAMLHVAVYAGVPKANSATQVIKRVHAERDGT